MCRAHATSRSAVFAAVLTAIDQGKGPSVERPSRSAVFVTRTVIPHTAPSPCERQAARLSAPQRPRPIKGPAAEFRAPPFLPSLTHEDRLRPAVTVRSPHGCIVRRSFSAQRKPLKRRSAHADAAAAWPARVGTATTETRRPSRRTDGIKVLPD